jgi:UPF0755 protein
MRKLSFLIVLLILIFGGVMAWWINTTSPVNPTDKARKAFTVKKGENVREIADNLKSEGLIKDPVTFFVLVKELGLDSKIQAGDFLLSPSMNATAIAKSLQVGTSDLTFVIPEGRRAQEIADTLKEKFPSYDESWRGQLIVNEGYLFPDTYSFSKDVTIDKIIETMRANFDKKYSSIPKNGSNNLSQEQIVILASMVEREAKHAKDRPLVASVMLNRIKNGMPLQIDATVQYALGYQPQEKNWWKKEVTFDDLKISSPYNTYTNTGLPPKPISNPGLDSLNAAVNPAKTNYIFYVSDKNGNNHYAATLDEHNANIKKYGL